MSIAFRIFIVIVLAFAAISLHHFKLGDALLPDVVPAQRLLSNPAPGHLVSPVDRIIEPDDVAMAYIWERSRVFETPADETREGRGGRGFSERRSEAEALLRRRRLEGSPDLSGESGSGDDSIGRRWPEAPLDGTHDLTERLPLPRPPDEGDATRREELEDKKRFRRGVYLVQEGESAWELAERFLGSGARHVEIEAANPKIFAGGRSMQEGDRLRIPLAAPARGESTVPETEGRTVSETSEKLKAESPSDDSTVEESSPSPLEVPPKPKPDAGPRKPRLHRVERDENLTKIAQRFYQDPEGWRTLFEANRDVLDSPDLVREGMTLKIPDNEVASGRVE